MLGLPPYQETGDSSESITGACVATAAVGRGLSGNLVGNSVVGESNGSLFGVNECDDVAIRRLLSRERRGTGVLDARASSTSDGTSSLVLEGMQWFNEPTATVNLINRPKSQQITMDCVASARS